MKTLTELIGKKNLCVRKKKIVPTYYIKTVGGKNHIMTKKEYKNYMVAVRKKKRNMGSSNMMAIDMPDKISKRMW